jgi:hypothetical protein
MMKSCGAALEAYCTVRKVFCQYLPDITKLTLLKLCEMDMQFAPLVDDGAVRRGPYGYVTLGNPEFVYARRAVLASLVDVLLVSLKVYLHAQGLVPVNDLDYFYYGTGPRTLRLSCLRGCFVCQFSSGSQDVRDLVNKERRCEHGLTQKGIINSTLV